MIKFLLKYSYQIISYLFLLAILLVVFGRERTENEFYIMLINYYFWYIFGLFTGIYLARIIIDNYTKMVKNEELKKYAN